MNRAQQNYTCFMKSLQGRETVLPMVAMMRLLLKEMSSNLGSPLRAMAVAGRLSLWCLRVAWLGPREGRPEGGARIRWKEVVCFYSSPQTTAGVAGTANRMANLGYSITLPSYLVSNY